MRVINTKKDSPSNIIDVLDIKSEMNPLNAHEKEALKRQMKI
jgi:hypothetical protein